MRFSRALLAFLVLPGTVAFLVPLVFIAEGPVADRRGLFLLAVGVAGLLCCVRDFYVSGKGTLAPWDPPRELVTVGLYRFSRNPMYLSVLTVIGSWAWLFQSAPLLLYAIGTLVVFGVRVVVFEEPWLARTHGEQWLAYKARVPRWSRFLR
ncbi:MAG TPA: methyltransferase [Vicinamibacterales bacterium]|nr:methyltransferase [Vicinamibacterales bacterium]